MTAPNPLPLVLSRRRFRQLLNELRRRGDNQRESGAFLLTRRNGKPVAGGYEVTEVYYYDDLDPGSLTGGITMHASGLSLMNQRCRANGLRVIGDIHTHPAMHVHQSTIDSNHPMIALPDHIALIAPNYATGAILPADLGAHRLRRGGGGWDAAYGADVGRMLHIRSGLSILFARLYTAIRSGMELR